MSKTKFTEIAEIISVVATIPTAVISNQAAIASIPVTIAFALNFFNRKSLIARAEQLAQQQANIPAEIAAIASETNTLQQQHSNLKSEVGQLQLSSSNSSKDSLELRSQLDKLAAKPEESDKLQEAIAALEAEQTRSTTELLDFQEQLTVAQTLNGQLFQFAQQWEKQYESWEQEKAALVEDMKSLVLTTVQPATSMPNGASFYASGLKHSEVEDWEAALEDYNKAIEIAPDYAEAYRDRGLAKAKLADKHGAVADLRKATQLFFDRGDIDSYNHTKELSKNLHEFSVLENSLELEPANVQNLFS